MTDDERLDRFAGLAMQALLSRETQFPPRPAVGVFGTIVADAYEIADAMIEQREYWIARRHKQEEPDGEV